MHSKITTEERFMTMKTAILADIRRFCVECSGGSRAEVSNCPMQTCPMFKYRMGKDPDPARSKAGAKLNAHTKSFWEENQE